MQDWHELEKKVMNLDYIFNELNEKFKKEPAKKQQETMKLYNKAGVNPMAGCIPALIQLPFMYASFQFFPSAFELRQKGYTYPKISEMVDVNKKTGSIC